MELSYPVLPDNSFAHIDVSIKRKLPRAKINEKKFINL